MKKNFLILFLVLLFGDASLLKAQCSVSLTTTPTNVTCNGSCNGSAQVSVSGTTATPYTYSWTPIGEKTSTATGLCANTTYTITVKDNTGCSATATVILTQPPPITPALTDTISSTADTCGKKDGVANVYALGGEPPYTYYWSSGASISSVSGLTAGSYEVSVYDASGCDNVNTTVVVGNFSPISVFLNPSIDVSCYGYSTGSASVNVSKTTDPSPGNPPYTYSWKPTGGTKSSATGLTAGTYTVTITDNNGCYTSAIFPLTQPAAIDDSVAKGSVVGVTCANDSNGSAAIGVNGGFTPYTYSWNPTGQTTSTGTGLKAKTYTITVTNGMDCANSVTVTITQPPPIKETLTVQEQSPCGEPIGSISAMASGGTTPYTYSWSPAGGTSATGTGMVAGTTYTLTTTDSNGCQGTGSEAMTGTPSPPLITSITNVTCNGGNNGSIMAVPGGGGNNRPATPYTYSWSPGGNTTSSITGLSAGIYILQVTDSLGCSATPGFVVNQPDAITGAINNPNIPCNGGTAAVSVQASGGNNSFKYSWTPGGQNTSSLNLTAGNYTVTIKDGNGCTSGPIPISVTQPNALVITGSINYPRCNGVTGSATAGVTGGVQPYTYSWVPSGETTSTATGLNAGTYTVTVNDNNNCTKTLRFIITQPPGDTVLITSPVATCAHNGIAWATLAPGSSGSGSFYYPYTYSWSPSPGGQIDDTATGLNAGTVYTVTITDNRGCPNTNSVLITESQPPAITINTLVNDGCYGASTGSATVIANGNTGIYTYSWSPGGQTSASINPFNVTGLSAGIYTLTVTDRNACPHDTTIPITQPPPITLTMGEYPTPCGMDTGSAWTGVSGGTQPYTYLWSPPAIGGQVTDTASHLSAGVYTVTVIDSNGCVQRNSETVTNLNSFSVNIIYSNGLKCNNDVNADAALQVSGGVFPYTYSWVPGGQTTAEVNGLSAGTYTVTITDNIGCLQTVNAIITQPTALEISTKEMPTPCGVDNGSAWAVVSGGTPPYAYSWDPTATGGQTTDTASNLGGGYYTITVTDGNGCTLTASEIVTTTTTFDLTVNSVSSISCYGDSNAAVSVTASQGVAAYSYLWIPPDGQTSPTATGLSAGTYTVLVTDSRGCNSNIGVDITQPAAITIAMSASPVPCGSTVGGGHAKAVASGGTEPYIYSWSPIKESTPTATGLSAGTYTLTVTDAHGCVNTATAVITQPAETSSAFTSNITEGCIPLCIQFSNKTSTISSPTYIWKFGDGDTSNAENPIYCYEAGGVYSVELTVLNSAGCTATLTKVHMITAYNFPNAAFSMSPQPATILSPTIQFTDKSTDTSGIIQWWWTFGDQTDSISSKQNAVHTYRDTGTYCAQLAVRDGNGCIDTATNCLVINPLFTLYIPDAFTPNGDGLNDVFMAKGKYVQSFEMYIFDRWGEKLFYTNNINTGWNGTVSGGTTTCPQDVYIYKILATDYENNQHSYVGSVVLLK